MCCYGVLRVRDTARPRISAVIAAGVHLFPFRTEKLSPPAPMVLGGQPPGRVGRRRINFAEPAFWPARLVSEQMLRICSEGLVRLVVSSDSASDGVAQPRLARTF